MNDRIKTLAEIAKTKVPPGLFVNNWIDRYNEEFAKLIIKECASIASHPTPGCSTSLGDMIENHFGIN